jgi:hypothetical protein
VAGRARGLPGVAQNLLDKRGEDYAAYMANPALEQYHFIGKDIRDLPRCSGPPSALQRPQRRLTTSLSGF